MKVKFPPLSLAVRHLLWLVAVALLALPARAETNAPSNALSAISLARGNNDSQVVKLEFKNAVAALPLAFTTSNPHRLVLDFPATSSALPRTSENPETGAVKNWQVAQAGQRTRVVINLTGPATYELRHDRNLVLAVLRAVGGQPGVPAPANFAETGPKSTHAIRDIDFRRGKDGESRVMVTLSNPGVGVDINQQGGAIQVDFLNTSLPTPLQRRLDVSDFATPAQLVETFEQGKHTRMRITPKGKWDYSAYQTGNQFTLEVRSLEGPQAAREGKPQYSGEKLSLNFQNVEVRAVLQVIADFTGLNIITSDTVSGNVTLRLKDVPWDQALDIILRAKGLDKRSTGNVIWVAPRDELAAKEKLELESRKAIESLEELQTEVIKLNYLRAQDAHLMINGQAITSTGTSERVTCSAQATGVGGGGTGGISTPSSVAYTGQTTVSTVKRMLSEHGVSTSDPSSNALIVKDFPRNLRSIREFLSTVDLPSKQVLIEARVVVADDAFSRTLGARLGFQTQTGSSTAGNTRTGLSSSAANATALTTGTAITGVSPANINLPATSLGPTTPSLGFTLINAASHLLINLELQALEADQRGKIVSNPRVITQNQKPAVILQGQQIPYITPATANSPASVSFKDAFLCLLVDPQVLNNDTIILNVEVQKDAAGTAINTGGGSAVPVETKRVKTQVRVKNGETAVLGGIFEQTLRNDTNKVPILGDIPIFGALFRDNFKTDEKTELLIFLTPRVLDDVVALQ